MSDWSPISQFWCGRIIIMVIANCLSYIDITTLHTVQRLAWLWWDYNVAKITARITQVTAKIRKNLVANPTAAVTPMMTADGAQRHRNGHPPSDSYSPSGDPAARI
eukprot:COSAG02_NODE_28061_length_597_cov_0.829317_1_plen_106_part_00